MIILNRDEHIFKKIKEHYNYVREYYPQYNIIYLGLQGSQNYELDTYTEEYTSDVDTKAILVPSLKDISYNKKPVSTTVVLPDNSHCDCKDIRLMMENFKKQNVNFLEILFTKYRIINPLYKDILLELINKREDIAHLNVNQAIRCMSGMSMEKKKALCHPYPSLIDKIEKYGYDGKQLHHIIRMNDFIKAYTSGKSFEECLTTYKDKEFLMCAKLNKFTVKEALKISDEYDKETHDIMIDNLIEQDVVNEETQSFMQDIQYRIIKRSIELEFKKEEPKNERFDYTNIDNKYNNIFVTSDIHFCHSNIIKYEEGRIKLLDEELCDFVKRKLKENNEEYTDDNINKYINLYYKDKVNVMNESIIELWNKTVKENDLVFILGDIALNFKDVESVNNLVEKLNGDKILILGNHDKELVNSTKFNKSLFKDIVNYKEVKIYGKTFVMSHYPIIRFNKQDKGNIHLYGHLHSTQLPCQIEHSFKVCMDTNNYKPVNIKEFIKMDSIL